VMGNEFIDYLATQINTEIAPTENLVCA
jgi:hypothetical protein